MQSKPGEVIQWHFDAPVWVAIQCFIAQWMTLKFFNYYANDKTKGLSIKRYYTKVYVVSSFSFVITVSVLVTIFEAIIGIQKINLDHILLLIGMNVILHAIVGGFTLALKAVSQVKQQQFDLEKIQKNLFQSQVKSLQQQIDPHFLFNNLNVLSALIQQDPDEADEYLENFSEIYRYVLQSQDYTLVTIEQELAFARNYMALIETRFDGAYGLIINQASNASLQNKMLPCALQLALENVVKHNQGSRTNPLIIEISISDHFISICNEIRKKPFKPVSTFIGLKNLQARCKSVFNRPLVIINNENNFTITLPLSLSE
jgi:LytS/YehU family sensor histidine kinase